MSIIIPVIMVPKYEQAICPWSCMGRFPQETIDLWSPIVLIGMCIALIASAFSYRGLFIRKNLPHNMKKVKVHLENVSVTRRNEVEKCERDLLFTAIGPWLLLLYWITLMMSNDFVAIPGTGLLALAFAVLYSTCNFIQSVFTTPVKYSNFMWFLMRFAPANYAPKFDPVTKFSRDEVLELLRQKEIDAEKGNNSKAKGLLIWNSTYPDYLPTCLRSIMLKGWTDSYLNARNSGKTKVEACYAVYNQHVLEMDPNTLHGKQTRELFLGWNVHIRQADPLPEPKEERLSLDKKLEKDFIAAMRNVFAPIGHERRDTVSATSMAEKVDFHIPLCSVVTIDKHGYVTQVNVLKAPVNMKSKEGRLLWKTDPNNNFLGGDSDRNYEWAMTSDEKIEAAAEEQADVVWDMAVQNCDFIQYSKALRI
uniref:Transmembrane protein n=1 Tax=Haemonchus contortus TaxID=6289 RepID=A0A7I4Z8N4_HAECO